MSFIELKNISKGYGSGQSRTEVLDNINLTVEQGEFVAIVGYSGSGKTTLMSLIAGLIEPDEGYVIVNGERVQGPSAKRGLVFQNYSLLPWLNVESNVGMAVDQVYASDDSRTRLNRVHESVGMVNLTPALMKKPSELSGGMRQRTSVARTLSMRPDVLLLDEPLSALDALTRSVIQDQILDIRSELGQTIILITNDVDEGLYMADRIIPLSIGPKSTFGPEVKVDIERPRDRAGLNHDDRFKRMRNQIIEYLLQQKEEEFAVLGGQQVDLPDVKPLDLTKKESHTFGWKRQVAGLMDARSTFN
ncbi:MAG: ABC transporter ATP-binding protein [Verrucomicrobiota bacterium]